MRIVFCLLLILGSVAGWSQSQDIKDLEAQLKTAETTKEKMLIHYELGEKYLRVNTDKALDHAKAAHNQSLQLKSPGMSARSAYLTGLAYERERDTRNTEVWMKSALQYAKQAGDSDIIIKSVDKRSKMATKDRNYRRAYEINQEAFNYFSQNGKSMSDLEGQYDLQKVQLEKEQRLLQKEKDALEFEVLNLKSDHDQLATDKSQLEVRQKQLLQSNKAKQEQLSQKDEEISSKAEELASIAEQKNVAERLAQKKEKEVKELTRDALEKKALLQEAELEVQHNQMVAEQSKYLRNLSIALAGMVFLLAMVFYVRYRSKRKTANSLAEKNKLIEDERQRSDELLLNILPASIAAELKESGKAKARKFTEVTVLFSDFKNFTRISEQLNPEELVEELDKCFKAFDFIIGQYPEIEKIKTIGDAYMCAIGLNDRKTMPHSLIKAALEMQEFLDEQMQERMRIGKPFFEARIGLHTGPVVAGVVGVKKFAYDIWGDTVNTAARVESQSQAGRVNISETTYRLVKYNFECEYRGKVEAKNKGTLDMYFVNRVLEGVAV
ncbi:MAG: hypothetical protein DHS20C18_05250 [Saprospiraceae bacterium]|nr:MAG: hypothetical protein DHS20C18_05250 [Saprospiraceae bacterium]